MQALIAVAENGATWGDAAARILEGRPDDIILTVVWLTAFVLTVRFVGVPIVEWYKDHYAKKLAQGEELIALERARQESDRRRDESREQQTALLAEEIRLIREQGVDRHREMMSLVAAIKPALERATAAGDKLDAVDNRVQIVERQINRLLAIAGHDSK